MKKLFFTLITILAISASSIAEPYPVYVLTVGTPNCRMYYVLIVEDNGTVNDLSDDLLLAAGWVTDCEPPHHFNDVETPEDLTPSEEYDVTIIDSKHIEISDSSENDIAECSQYTVRVTDPITGETQATGVLFEDACGLEGVGPTN